MDEKYIAFTLVGYRKIKPQIISRINLNSAVTIVTKEDRTRHPKFHLEKSPKLARDTESVKIKPLIENKLYQNKSPLIVVSIDFGTTYTGYAFVFKHDKEQVHYMKKDFGLDNHSKIPTTLLLDSTKEFHSFGYEARTFFHNLDPGKSSRYFYFENFKMNLYQEKVSEKLKLKSVNQNGQVDALKVFTITIEYLCSQAMKEIGDQCAFSLTKDDIAWVITVPAIWSDASKQFMRLAAQQCKHINLETLKIALEPEVASLYCRKYLKEESQCTRTNKIKGFLNADRDLFEFGTSYLIVDFGGGTVDITAHRIQKDGFIKEIHKSTGGSFGSNEINKKFEEMICSIFGNKLWKKFKKKLPSTYLDLVQTFELRKREAQPNRTSPYNILLTYSFIKFFDSSLIEKLFDKAPNGLSFSAKLGLIRIDAPLMRKLFQSIIEPTIQTIRSLLNGPLKTQKIRYIFFVGGFAQSSMLKREVKLEFEPETNVIVPYQAHLAVLYGACQYGLNPTLIRSRKVMRTYGIGMLEKFDHHFHPLEKKISIDGIDWCCDVFDIFVKINQSIGMFESIKRQYKPIFSNQISCILHIYSTSNADPRFVTDPGVNKCGTLYLELDPIKYPENVNPAIKQFSQREIDVEMFFGETEIKITAKDTQTGYLVKSNVDFLSKIE